jgi:hypothetical protein
MECTHSSTIKIWSWPFNAASQIVSLTCYQFQAHFNEANPSLKVGSAYSVRS